MNTDLKIKNRFGDLCARIACFPAFSFVLFGCSGGPLVPVEGVVTLDGKPLDGAVIQFSPAARGQIATGASDSSGRFVMTTRKDGDGALPGKYKVAVFKQVVAAADVQPLDPSNPILPSTDVSKAREMAETLEEEKRKSGIPEVYWTSGKSPLVVDVPEGGDTNVELKLESAAE